MSTLSSEPARSRAFDALGWSFAVTSDDPRVVDYVDGLYAGLPDAPSDAEVDEYAVVADDEVGYELTREGARLSVADDPSALVMHLVHDVNRCAIDATEMLTAHAGGVVGDAGAVVLPAHMESGKTTLTAGLVRAGFGYLSDEAVAFDFETLGITGYAKPLSIDSGAWALFPALEPQAPFERDGYKAEQWQVEPDRIRAGAVVASARARCLVFPEYVAGAPTVLLPIGRAEGVVELAKNTFHFRRHGRRGLDAFARLVPEVECFRLRLGDLDAGIAAVTELVGSPG